MSNSAARRTGAMAALLTVVGAASAGTLVALSPVLGLGAVLGGLCFVLAVRLDPKTLAVAGLIVILMAKTLEIGSGWVPRPTATRSRPRI